MPDFSFLDFFIHLSLIALLSWKAPEACAEYRVYQYYVRDKNRPIQDQESYLVTSTLDPLSFLSYHGGYGALTIDFLRTWICPGATSGRPTCEGPCEKVLLKKLKAAKEKEKGKELPGGGP